MRFSMLAREHTIACHNFLYPHCCHHCCFGLCWVASLRDCYLHTQPYHRPTEDLVCFGQNPSAREQQKLQNLPKWLDKWTLPLKLFCHPCNARLCIGLPLQPWPSFELKFAAPIFPTGALEVSCGYRTWFKGNYTKFPLQLYSPCPPYQSTWFIRSLTLPILLTTTVTIAPRLIFQGQIIQHMNSIYCPQVKAFPPASWSCPPPPWWPSCSPVALKATLVTHVIPITIMFISTMSLSGREIQLVPAIPPSGKLGQATPVIPAAVPRCTMRRDDGKTKGSQGISSSGKSH
jgi:hypothetical protein